MPRFGRHLLRLGKLVGADDASADEDFGVVSLSFLGHQRLQLIRPQGGLPSGAQGSNGEMPCAARFTEIGRNGC